MKKYLYSEREGVIVEYNPEGRKISEFVSFKSRKSLSGTLVSGWLYLSEESITQQSDNIEDLCNEIIIFWKRKKFPTNFHFTEPVESYLKAYSLNRKDIKEILLGRWTKRGLIYLAKVNDKGEIELL